MKLLITIFAVMVLLGVSISALPAFADSTVVQDFDKDACYAKCACATGMFVSCAACKAECDREYWRAFDREMGDDTISKKKRDESE